MTYYQSSKELFRIPKQTIWRRRVHYLVLLMAIPSLLYLNISGLDTNLQVHHGLASTGMCEISPLLGKLLVVVSFHWNVTKLIYLTTMLDTIRTYKTRVHVVIVTNQAQALRRALQKTKLFSGNNPTLQITQAPPTEDTNEHALLWAHRKVIEDQLDLYPNFTSIIYMEDDTRLSWPAVISWALDTEVLTPLNFSRCIYRTETDVETGGSNILDWTRPLDLTYENTLNVTHKMDYARVRDRLRNASICRCGEHRDGTPWPCRVHDNYFAPSQPYQGMWMASRAQLASFIAHPYWTKEGASNGSIDFIIGYPERTTFMNLVVNVPTAYRSSCMVPYIFSDSEGEGRKASLPVVAEVEHMRNGYSTVPHSPYAKIHVEAAIRELI